MGRWRARRSNPEHRRCWHQPGRCRNSLHGCPAGRVRISARVGRLPSLHNGCQGLWDADNGPLRQGQNRFRSVSREQVLAAVEPWAHTRRWADSGNCFRASCTASSGNSTVKRSSPTPHLAPPRADRPLCFYRWKPARLGILLRRLRHCPARALVSTSRWPALPLPGTHDEGARITCAPASRKGWATPGNRRS